MKLAQTNQSWKHEVTGPDGNCVLFGVNVFDYQWNDTGQIALVVDPQYHKKHSFSIYTINIDGTRRRFAAGEFSNCLWGFFVEK